MKPDNQMLKTRRADISRRQFLWTTGSSMGIALGLGTACGPQKEGAGISSDPAEYPSQPLSMICPWAAGGGTDRLSRFLAEKLSEDLGKPSVVVNRTGGSGAVGHHAGATADPDGHTLLMATFELSTMRHMGISELSYEDYIPVMQLNADAAALIVKKDSPWTRVEDLLEAIRSRPGELKMSGTSTGGAWDLARAGFLMAADLPVSSVIWVPTKGSAPSIIELLGGHVDVVCCSLPEASSQIEAGELRALAVMSPERLEEYPDTPTVKEAGVDWEAVGWRGLTLPLNTPEAIVEKISSTMDTIVASDDFKDFMKKNGFAIQIRKGAAFEEFLKSQDAQWKTVIQAAGYAK